MAATKYRLDIDGLRAIAVLAVIAYHFGITRFSGGGYVGVDVFFVISGFLITQILIHDIREDRYSLIDFYHRRARRILPALFVVFLFCMIAAWLLRLPSEIAAVGRSMAASLLFSSNVMFWSQSDYFDDAMHSNPLLHTWSLSVEEQFYLLFPLLLMACRRLPMAATRRWIIALSAISLGLAVAQTYRAPADAFYLVPFRAWELLLGSLVAVGGIPVLRTRLVAELVAATGLAMIGAAVVLYSKSTPFPGLAAVIPTAGAAAVLHAGLRRTTLTHRLLGSLPLRYVGLMSYSLYLWHWPLYTFFSDLYIIRSPQKGLLLALSFVMGWVSWRWIERPFRTQPFRVTQRRALGWSLGATGSLLVLAWMLGVVAKEAMSVPPRAEHLIAASQNRPDDEQGVGTCFLTPRFNGMQFFQDHCLAPVAGKRNVLVMGDSHSAHLMPGLRRVYPNTHFLQASASGCKPTIETEGERRCTDLMQHVFRDFLSRHAVDRVVLAARWTKNDAHAIVQTAREIARHDVDVVVFGPVPEYEPSLPLLLARAIAKHSVDPSDYAQRHLSSIPVDADRTLRTQNWPARVTYVSAVGALCPDRCTVLLAGDEPAQFDYGHLTQAGSVYLVQAAGAALLGSAPGTSDTGAAEEKSPLDR